MLRNKENKRKKGRKQSSVASKVKFDVYHPKRLKTPELDANYFKQQPNLAAPKLYRLLTDY